MTTLGNLPGAAPGRPSGLQRKFGLTSQSRQIAPVTGSDMNTGLPGSPWKTWGRYLDHIGPAFIDGGAVHTIEYLEDAPAIDPILTPNVGSTGSLFIQAASSAIVTVRSSTFTAVQAQVPALNTPLEVSDGALIWKPFQQMQLMDTRSNSVAWVLQDVGGGSARISIPSAAFGGGDPYEVRSIPLIGAIKFTNCVVAGGTITISNLAFVDGCIVPQLGFIDIVGNSAVSFDQCHLGGGTGRPMQGWYSANSCMIVDPNWVGSPVLNNVGLLGGPVSLAVIQEGAFVVMNQCNAQSVTLVVEQGAVFADTLAIFDGPNNGVQLDQCGSLEVNADLYGSGNFGKGAVVFRGNSSVTWGGNVVPTLTGVGGNVLVGGAAHNWSDAPLDIFGAVISKAI